jgi:four helix bundle protein
VITDGKPQLNLALLPEGVRDVDFGARGYQLQGLIAWRKATSLVTAIYELTTHFPRHEMYGLISQLRSAPVSIASNIAEGHGRATLGEFAQFLCQARGSLCEVETQIVIAGELGYIDLQQDSSLTRKTVELGRILNGLISSIQRRRLHRPH